MDKNIKQKYKLNESINLIEQVFIPKSEKELISELNKIKNNKVIKKSRFQNIPEWKFPKYIEAFDPILIDQDRKAMRSTMWNYAGIIRTSKGLERANADLSYFAHRIFHFYQAAKLDRSIIELRNAIVSSQIIIKAAIHNDKSLGCHYIQEDKK